MRITAPSRPPPDIVVSSEPSCHYEAAHHQLNGTDTKDHKKVKIFGHEARGERHFRIEEDVVEGVISDALE